MPKETKPQNPPADPYEVLQAKPIGELQQMARDGDAAVANAKRQVEQMEQDLGRVRWAIHNHPRNGFTDAQWEQKIENEKLQAAKKA